MPVLVANSASAALVIFSIRAWSITGLGMGKQLRAPRPPAWRHFLAGEVEVLDTTVRSDPKRRS
ncbi:MAG TPA: hypothetical protein VFD04_06585, partial [Actinomycetes bacterium]|nr:hypothetical protein [Actinomycetes bacterium]